MQHQIMDNHVVANFPTSKTFQKADPKKESLTLFKFCGDDRST